MKCSATVLHYSMHEYCRKVLCSVQMSRKRLFFARVVREASLSVGQQKLDKVSASILSAG